MCRVFFRDCSRNFALGTSWDFSCIPPGLFSKFSPIFLLESFLVDFIFLRCLRAALQKCITEFFQYYSRDTNGDYLNEISSKMSHESFVEIDPQIAQRILLPGFLLKYSRRSFRDCDWNWLQDLLVSHLYVFLKYLPEFQQVFLQWSLKGFFLAPDSFMRVCEELVLV